MTSIERNVLRAAVFLSGAMLMAAEISAFRIVGKTFGTALRETTAVIAIFLTAMSAGYWAGGRAGDRWPRPHTIVTVLLGAAVTLLWVPWLDAWSSPRIAASGINMSVHALIATSVLFAIPTALFAAVSPIAVRLFATNTGESGSTAGSISAISTVGSIAGSIFTAYFLLDWLESISRTLIFVSYAAALTAAVLLLSCASRAALRRWAPVLGLAAIAAVPLVLWARSASIDKSLTQDSFGWKSVFVGDSSYHHIIVRQHADQVRHLFFGQSLQSSMYMKDPFGPGLKYSAAVHIGKLIRPDIKRVLIIGLGGGTLPRQFTHYYPEVVVDVVEIDPMVVDVAKQFFQVEANDRLRIHVIDGRRFLQRSSEKWDLILLDAYTTNRYGGTVVAHLTTREFLTMAASHLNPGGVLHFHVAFGETRLRSALQKTIGSVFSSVLSTEGEIIASDTPLITTKEVISERARSSPAGRLPHMASYITTLGPPPPPSAYVPLLTDDYAPVDTLMRQTY